MELPDCPPGAEGYQDSVTEVPKKPNDDCTKAEYEFQEHLNSLKIKLENGETRCMVERRGRDVSSKWIYLCYPCAAMCSGESVLQTHISGKKHKNKLSMRNVWPLSIFEEHPYYTNEKVINKGGAASDKVLQKMAEEVDLYNKNPSELDVTYNKYRDVKCHIQETIDNVKAPLLGLEYLIEHPPIEAHYEPSYMCTLCSKQGHPRTIINHMTCFWHRYNYLLRHFPKASNLLTPYRNQNKYREGVSVIMNRLAQRVEDKYGRLRPVNIDKEIYEKEREAITSWLFKGYHFTESLGATFEEVVDIGLITSLHESNEASKAVAMPKSFGKKDPSPPVVAAPSKPHFNNFTRSATRVSRRAGSAGSLSDVSDEPPLVPHRPLRDRHDSTRLRYDPYDRQGSRYLSRDIPDKFNKTLDKTRAPNYEYKLKLAAEKRQSAEDSLKKTLAYHEKNPEKHPLYPEEWKKFWNRRYKEIQAEGGDPTKHDFKPEWILFWTNRMKELHEEEVRGVVNEVYRKLCLTPPDLTRRSPHAYRLEDDRKRSPDRRRRSPEHRARSPMGRRRSPELRRRSPELRRRSPDLRRRSPSPRRRSPSPRRRSPDPRRRELDFRRREPPRRRDSDPRRRSPDPRRLPSPNYNTDSSYRRDIRSPNYGSPPRRAAVPMRQLHTRSRSPISKARGAEGARRSRSPLSRRDPPRNRSPAPAAPPAPVAHPHELSLQTVLISDDELNPDDGGLSPWNSDGDVDSVMSLPESSRSRGSQRPRRPAGSHSSHAGRSSHGRHSPRESDDLGPPENVVATLRMLVALEDYLGSIGPRLVDLLTEALKMEKERANSSEELLERESAVVLVETGKEKLKGAVQAGLVAGGAAAAVRRAVVRCAATLHEADKRATKKKKTTSMVRDASGGASGSAGGAGGAGGVAVCGVGEVDRAQIAHQMAAALVAQGKTDVSAEELAQLVDAVVGMAEAKKREAAKNKTESTQSIMAASKMSGTASALQMLQSAYDENEKRIEKDDAPDAMDGLSDSDLETLLKNFNELSAEEQHSLIAYLKKLEAREPQRVERLRQYVSAAAAAAPLAPAAVPAPAPAPAAAPAPAPAPAAVSAPEPAPAPSLSEPVAVDSDDDDYTVEEVFISATKRVKEDKIRQEMEIVKKSLEELKAMPSPTANAPAQAEPAPAETTPVIDLTNHISSAADLFALVQASIQSTSTTPANSSQASDLVTTNMQIRSFGDNPEPLIDNLDSTKPLQRQPLSMPPSAPFINQPSGLQRSTMDQNYGNRNMSVDNELFDQPSSWNSSIPNVSDDRGPTHRGPNVNNFGSDNSYNHGNRAGNFMNGRGQENYDARQTDMYQQNHQHQQPHHPHQLQHEQPRQPLQQRHQPLQQPQQQHQPLQQQNQPLQQQHLPHQQQQHLPHQQQQQLPHQQQHQQHHLSHQSNQQQHQHHNQPHQQHQHPPYGNHEPRNYGRRGGRGHFGGGQRGRGRGNYY